MGAFDIDQLVDSVFEKVLYNVEYEVVKPGTHTSVTDPEFSSHYKQWETEKWLRQQSAEAQRLAESLSCSEKRERKIRVALQKASVEVETRRVQLNHNPTLPSDTIGAQSHELGSKHRSNCTRQRPLPSSPRTVLEGEDLRRFQEAQRKIRKFRKDALEREKKREERRRVEYNKVKSESEHFAELARAREDMNNLQREIDAIERHKRFVVERSKRKQQLIKLQYDSLAAKTSNHITEVEVANGRQNTSGVTLPKQPAQPRRIPLYKRMEQEFVRNVELPLIEARKRKLQAIHNSKSTPTADELASRAKLLKQVEIAKAAKFRDQQRELRAEWRRRRLQHTQSRYPNGGNRSQTAALEAAAKAEKREQQLELRKRQREYDKKIRNRIRESANLSGGRQNGGVSKSKQQTQVEVHQEFTLSEENLIQVKVTEVATKKTVPTPPTGDRPASKTNFPHRATTEFRTPGKTLQQLQNEAARLEEQIAMQEALINEKMGTFQGNLVDEQQMRNSEILDGDAMVDEVIKLEQEKLSQLYVSTIENKMKVLEAVMNE